MKKILHYNPAFKIVFDRSNIQKNYMQNQKVSKGKVVIMQNGLKMIF